MPLVNRRSFLGQVSAAVVAAGARTHAETGRGVLADGPAPDPRSRLFRISLAEWSFHRALFGGQMDHLDFPRVAKLDYDISGIELVNQFFKDKARDRAYLKAFSQRAMDLNVRSLLIMIDGEGALGDPDEKARLKAVDNHKPWIEAAVYLGCHSIRVNAETHGVGTFVEQQDRAADGLRRLSDFAHGAGLNVLVENHGHLSSNGAWLSGVMQKVGWINCGTLPDFGNFDLGDGVEYDRYRGVQEMMPYARAVSAKSHDFDDQGNETHTDFRRMMHIVLDSGYRGWVGIEYEGDKTSESEGVIHTKRLLEAIQTEFEPQYS